MVIKKDEISLPEPFEKAPACLRWNTIPVLGVSRQSRVTEAMIVQGKAHQRLSHVQRRRMKHEGADFSLEILQAPAVPGQKLGQQVLPKRWRSADPGAAPLHRFLHRGQ